MFCSTKRDLNTQLLQLLTIFVQNIVVIDIIVFKSDAADLANLNLIPLRKTVSESNVPAA